MKPEQARLKEVLIESISIMCQKGLSEYKELSIKGVIAVTIDKCETIVVDFNRSFDPTTVLDPTFTPKCEFKESQHISQNISRPAFSLSNGLKLSKSPRFMPQSANRLNRPRFQNVPSPRPMRGNFQNALVPFRQPRPKTARQSPKMYSNQLVQMEAMNGMMGTQRGRGHGAMMSRGSRGSLIKSRGGKTLGQISQPKNDSSFKLITQYVCGIRNCNTGFVSLSNLRRHQKTKHADYQGDGLVPNDDNETMHSKNDFN